MFLYIFLHSFERCTEVSKMQHPWFKTTHVWHLRPQTKKINMKQCLKSISLFSFYFPKPHNIYQSPFLICMLLTYLIRMTLLKINSICFIHCKITSTTISFVVYIYIHISLFAAFILILRSFLFIFWI